MTRDRCGPRRRPGAETLVRRGNQFVVARIWRPSQEEVLSIVVDEDCSGGVLLLFPIDENYSGNHIGEKR
jgi:hypothetical protein